MLSPLGAGRGECGGRSERPFGTARRLAPALLIAVLAALTFSSPAAVSKPVVQAGPLAQERQLLAIEREWDDAVVNRDAKVLERILADDFRLIWIDGSVSNKAELIAGVTNRKATIDPFSTEDVKVRIYGDTAILTGRFTQTARLGTRSETNSFRYTDVYVRKAGRWRAVSAHASLLRDGPR